jgi:DNA-binding NarL/FixJ family response regulator
MARRKIVSPAGSSAKREPSEGAPPGLRATRFSLGSDELVVFSFPLTELSFPSQLSAAEREVTRGMLEGRSNSAIAAKRGTSMRTVANQIASIFQKLRISSRAELAARLRELEEEPPSGG